MSTGTPNARNMGTLGTVRFIPFAPISDEKSAYDSCLQSELCQICGAPPVGVEASLATAEGTSSEGCQAGRSTDRGFC